jgi:hypothetical protein
MSFIVKVSERRALFGFLIALEMVGMEARPGA